MTLLLFYIAIALLCSVFVSFGKNGTLSECMGRRRCDAIKGVCILLVFARHIREYFLQSGCAMDSAPFFWGVLIDNAIGQLLVAPFLFYSGYGVMESIRRKGDDYVLSIPKRRILPTFANFGVAVCAFIALGAALGRTFEWSHLPLWLLGWESIGNSNWYIFVILLCYALTFFTFIVRIGIREKLLLLSFFSVAAVAVLSHFKTGYWSNTLLCYPAGAAVSFYRERLERFCIVRPACALALPLCAFISAYAVFYVLKIDFMNFGYNSVSIAFALLLARVSINVKIDNAALRWLGRNLFPIYIYQRVAMIVMLNALGKSFVSEHGSAYFLSSLVLTLVIAALYRFWRIGSHA